MSNNYNAPTKLTSAYKHIELYAGRNRSKASGCYERGVSYHLTATKVNALGYKVNYDLLPKRAVCSHCQHWYSQRQTRQLIKTLRRGFGRVGYCPNCGVTFDSLESAF